MLMEYWPFHVRDEMCCTESACNSSDEMQFAVLSAQQARKAKLTKQYLLCSVLMWDIEAKTSLIIK
jgi:hypothetical protein